MIRFGRRIYALSAFSGRWTHHHCRPCRLVHQTCLNILHHYRYHHIWLTDPTNPYKSRVAYMGVVGRVHALLSSDWHLSSSIRDIRDENGHAMSTSQRGYVASFSWIPKLNSQDEHSNYIVTVYSRFPKLKGIHVSQGLNSLYWGWSSNL